MLRYFCRTLKCNTNSVVNSNIPIRFYQESHNVVSSHKTSLPAQKEHLPTSDSILPNAINLQALAEERSLMLTYSDVLKDVVENGNCDSLYEAKQHMINLLKYTLPYGRQFEGVGILHSYKLIECPEKLTRKSIKLAEILSWCVAMQNASQLTSDDIMDLEDTRKGIPCWHTLNNVGLTAINDSFLLQNSVFTILKKHFSDHPGYLQILDAVHQCNYEIAIGQLIDTTSKFNDRPRFDVFTRERLNFLAQHKTTAFSYKYTLQLAMYLAGIFEHALHEKVVSITSQIGFLLTVHNDMQDAFYEEIGKQNTDIRNGKCTWLAVEALERGTPAQRHLFIENYGKKCDRAERIIKDLYKELNLIDVYIGLERHIEETINNEINHISHRIPKKVFDNFMSDITMYKYCDH